MADFKLNSDGDLDIDGGLTLITSYEEEAKQRLTLAIGLNLGEWFADATQGLPWIKNPNEDYPESIRYMLGDKLPNTPEFITGLLDDYIESQEYVASVESSYTFDKATRVYTYTPSVELLNGGTLSLTPYQTNL